VKILIDKNDIIVEGVACLDLALTLDCGQAFRWEKQDDGSFSGVAGGYFLNIAKRGNGDLVFKNTTKDSFDNFFRNYFDLDKDYEKICQTLKEDPLLSSTIDAYYGIRILNQEPWEALCSFIISQNNNVSRIKRIITRLCETYGDEICDGWYAFPRAEQLAALSAEDFEALGCGYRAKYLAKFAKDVDAGRIDLDKIKSLPLEEARGELLNIYGVGVKVADCALLFGFQFYSAFPLDVWMKRVMEYYPEGLPPCFKGVEGIAQQYLFHWARNNL